jgi:glycosyltransferase involved in cell wall biosynthesis
MVVDVMKIIIHKGHNIKLNIYGAGYYSPEKNSLLKKINDFGLEKNIIIHDYIDRSIMLKKLNKSIIYISTARYEGLPYAIMEAMSLGLPCIVTDVEGNNELVKDGINGYLISPFNSKDMASRIIELIEDNENRELFGQKAKQIFNDEHNIENNIKKLKKLYQQHGR